jgi:hypothetical protein
VFAPFSNGFVHVDDFAVGCQGGSACFRPSPALRTVFFPSRLQVMGAMLDEPIVDNPCDNTGGTGTGGSSGSGFGGTGFGGVSGAGAVGGVFGMGGAVIAGAGGAGFGGVMSPGGRGGGGRMGMAGAGPVGGDGGGFGMGGSPPAPIVEIELPSADEPIDELDERDGEIREAYGERTLSGRSARSTH